MEHLTELVKHCTGQSKEVCKSSVGQPVLADLCILQSKELHEQFTVRFILCSKAIWYPHQPQTSGAWTLASVSST